MRVPRRFTVSACLLSLATLFFARPAEAAPIRYVALGDSYASGYGAGSYSGGSCYRSSRAYPALWAAAHPGSSLTFAACSGATTTDVLNSQLSALNANTNLITITIGGNDVGFSSVMQTCVLQATKACRKAVDTAKDKARTQLPGSLRTLFSVIRTKSPSARVIVLDYPRLYKVVKFCAGLNNAKRTALNEGADVLDSAISAATSAAGFTLAGVRSKFAGHELCTGDGWLNAVTYPFGESYHPEALGQRSGYLTALDGATLRAKRKAAASR